MEILDQVNENDEVIGNASRDEIYDKKLMHRIVHVLVFNAQSMPDQLQGALANCGLHRCVQLLITTQNSYFIDLLPVVDLSDNRVVNVTLNSGQ